MLGTGNFKHYLLSIAVTENHGDMILRIPRSEWNACRGDTQQVEWHERPHELQVMIECLLKIIMWINTYIILKKAMKSL